MATSTAQTVPRSEPIDPAAAALLRGLNREQAAAVAHAAAALRILAGAGSGKTRVLTNRIAFRAATGVDDPRRVLAVTFTRKAADELQRRLGQLGLRDHITAGTFHSIAYAQLRQRWQELGARPPTLLDRKASFVGRLLRQRNRTTLLDTIAEVEWAAARGIGPERYVEAAHTAQRSTPLGEYGHMAEFLQTYATAKARARVVDFDDLLRLAAEAFDEDPAYATARRWLFRHLYVDEFQDVNPLQFRLLQAWRGDDGTVCVVGDPRQAIYSWNGADSRYLRNFDRYIADAATVELTQNYRSTPQVLNIANAILSGDGASPLRARRPDGLDVRVAGHDDDAKEAASIARAVRDRHAPGHLWAEQAVLVRTNAQVVRITEALARAAIPFRSRSGDDFLRSPEVVDALREGRRSRSMDEFLGDLQFAVDADTTEDHHRDNLRELIRLGHEFARMDTGATPEGFEGWLRTTVSGAFSNEVDGVDVMSFHAAKGLEWPIVHVAGCEVGLVPIHHADTPAAWAEERRLFYVAVTRAEDELVVHWARNRSFGARSSRREPSPFIGEVEQVLGIISEVQRPPRNAARPRPKARRAAPRDGMDAATAETFERLRKWRINAARAANVPAFVICNDATLRALADHRPRTVAALLEIPGIGATKADRFGPALLKLLAEGSTQND